MVDKDDFFPVLEGTWAEGMLIGIPALTIVITVIVRIGIRVVGKVKQVRLFQCLLGYTSLLMLGFAKYLDKSIDPTYVWSLSLQTFKR